MRGNCGFRYLWLARWPEGRRRQRRLFDASLFDRFEGFALSHSTSGL
jgi:hypothetical protein